MKVTSVEPQTKNPHRFNIFLDGKFAFGADEDLVVERRLIVGKEIPKDDLEKILFEAEIGKLMEKVYGLLSRRMRSEKEIRDYLRRLNYKLQITKKEQLSGLVIDATVDKLKQKGLINDKEFAKAWVEARGKKKSIRAIQAELFKKGISKEIINDKLLIINEGDEEQIARKLLEKRIDRWKNLSDLEKKKKAYEYLARRGFDYEIIKHIVDKYFEK